MLHKTRQVKHESVHIDKEMLYALVNKVFTEIDKTVVESQQVGFYIDGLYYGYPTHGGHERKSKSISGCSTIYIGRTKFVKEILIKVK